MGCAYLIVTLFFFKVNLAFVGCWRWKRRRSFFWLWFTDKITHLVTEWAQIPAVYHRWVISLLFCEVNPTLTLCYAIYLDVNQSHQTSVFSLTAHTSASSRCSPATCQRFTPLWWGVMYGEWFTADGEVRQRVPPSVPYGIITWQYLYVT